MPSTTTKPWTEIAELVMVDTPGAELAAVLLAIKRAAREFYEQSTAWREVCNPGITIQGMPDYDVLDVRDVTVVAVVAAFVGRDTFQCGLDGVSRFVTPARMRALHQQAPLAMGAPEFVAYVDDNLWFWPKPAMTGQDFGATLALAPTLARAGLPSHLMASHQEAIAAGARFYLMRSMNKPYSNPAGAAQAEAEFIAHQDDARHAADTAGAPASFETRVYYS